MGDWNPIADVAKAVENVSNEVGKGIQTVAQIEGNVGNLIGGDVGKAIQQFTAPAGAWNQVSGDVLRGDYKGAVSRSVGAVVGAQSAVYGLGNDFVDDLARNKDVNNISGGITNDFLEARNSSHYMMQTGDHRAQDWSSIGRAGIRAAVVTAGGIGAESFMPAAGSGSFFAEGASAAANTVGAALTGVATKEISNLVKPPQAAQASTSPTVAAPSSSMVPMMLMGGLGLAGLILLKRN